MPPELQRSSRLSHLARIAVPSHDMFVNSFSLSVRDVLGKTWPVTLEYSVNTLLATGPKTSDIPSGSWSIRLNENVNSLSIRVSHEQFPTQSAIITLGPQGPTWDNRNVSAQVSGQEVNIAVTLCRIRQAPCVTVPKPLVERPQSAEAKRFDLRQFQRGIWIDPGDPKARYIGISRVDPTKDSAVDGYPLTQLRTSSIKTELCSRARPGMDGIASRSQKPPSIPRLKAASSGRNTVPPIQSSPSRSSW